MAWITLVIAGLLEIGWAIGLKFTHGFSRLWPSIGTVIFMVASVSLLSWSMRTLPAGTAYAVWTGIGAVGTAILGVILFDEPVSPLRVTALALIAAGILGLKLGV